MANRYWVGGTGTWDFSVPTPSNWSATSGGPSGASEPGASDSVFFDTNSGSGTVTVKNNVTIIDLDFTGFAGTFAHFAGSNYPSITGSLTLSPGMTYTTGTSGSFVFSTSATHNLISSGKTIYGVGVSAGTLNMLDDLTVKDGLSVFGTPIVNTNNYDFTGRFFSINSATTSANLGSSLITLTTTHATLPLIWNVHSAATINSGTSTIKLLSQVSLSNSALFTGGGKTYYNLWLTSSNAYKTTINDSNTFNDLKIDGNSRDIKFTAGTTQTVTSFTANSTSGKVLTLQSTSSGSKWFISKATGSVRSDYLSIKDSGAIGGSTWEAYNSTDAGNNTGWSFVYPTANVIGSSSIGLTPIVKFSVSVAVVGTSDLYAYGVVRVDPSSIERKTFLYKVYDENDVFVEVWNDVIDEPEWSQELNSTGSAMTVTLARNSDSLATSTQTLLDNTGAVIQDNNSSSILTTVETRSKVGPGSSVNHNYRVDIFVFYGEVGTINDNNDSPILDNNGEELLGTIGAPNGIRRFSGFIAEINTRYGGTETTQVQLMSYGFDLEQYLVNSGGNTTVPFNSYDPGDMVRQGLTQFTTDAAGESYTTYIASTVLTTGTIANYKFRVNTYKELLEIATKLAPSDWFYYVGLGDNYVRFKSKPSTAQHTFLLGKHIKELDLRSYIANSTNDVTFAGGGDPALYTRYTEAPVTGTRRKLQRLSDTRVELEASADLLGQNEIDQNKAIQYRTTVDILDRTYDIESIEIGDMVTFANFDNYVDGLLMQVVALNYTPDVITLQLDTLPPTVNKRLEELKKDLDAQQNQYVPVAPS